MKKIVVIGIFCLLMLPASAFGHKLIPTDGTNIDYESALNIPDPVISWAMYEELEDNGIEIILSEAKAKGVPVALDNTYASGVYFDAFSHGVDLSIQALTKYVGGHSDLLLGSVSVKSKVGYKRVGDIFKQLGLAVSPDDCSLALRGLQTLAVRLDALEIATLKVASWLGKHTSVERLFHPAFETCPGHQIWKRDFSGSTGLF